MSTATNTIQTSINVAAQPGSLALSRDSQYLLVAHFNNSTPPVPSANLLTLIHLTDNSQRTFITSDPPLGVAFFATVPQNGAANLSGPGMALVVTTTGFYTLDPASGNLQVISTLTNLANAIPVPVPTFPGQILETALATSGDGTVIWGIGGAGTGSQVIYQYHALTNSLYAEGYVSAPPLLPRVSVSNDGSYAMVGWILLNSSFVTQSKYPERAHFYQRYRARDRFRSRHHLRSNPRCIPAYWPTLHVHASCRFDVLRQPADTLDYGER